MKHFIVKRKKNKKDTVPSRTAQLDALEPFSAGKMKPHCTKHSKPVPALGSWDTLKLWSLTQTFQSELCCWSVAQARSTLCDPMDAACHASLSCTLSWSLLKLMSIESMIPSNHLILCHSPSPPAFNLSQHQCLYQWVSSSHQVDKVLKLQLQHQSCRWIFRVDFL